jgi:hypothetical protein
MSGQNQHIINIKEDDNKHTTESELQLLKDVKMKTIQTDYLQTNTSSSKVIFYCPFDQRYTKIENYEIQDILSLIKKYKSENYFIIQIDNDEKLYDEILKMHFKSDFENIHKMFDLKLDYCFSPVYELLCFNLSILTNIFFDEIEKYLIQIFFYKNGLYIINKDCCDHILGIFISKFHFQFQEKEDFFQKTDKIGGHNLVNNLDLNKIIKQKELMKESPMKIKRNHTKDSKKMTQSIRLLKQVDEKTSNINIVMENKSTELTTDVNPEIREGNNLNSVNLNEIKLMEKEISNSSNQMQNNCSSNHKRLRKSHTIKLKKSQTSSEMPLVYRGEGEPDINKEKEDFTQINDEKDSIQIQSNILPLPPQSNFSTDDLIYWILTLSLEKLEEVAESLSKEADSLKGIYLELSENERKDFFRRIHTMEVSLQLIYQETIIKKKFLKYSKNQFKQYNKLSHNFYFKNSFNFFIELMISKVTQLEITFEKLQNILRMIKENYSIIIEDNTEKQNVKLSSVMKVLAIITTVYAPFNIIPGIWGMNVKVPFMDAESLWPFFGIMMFLICLMIAQLLVFKKLKWF